MMELKNTIAFYKALGFEVIREDYQENVLVIKRSESTISMGL